MPWLMAPWERWLVQPWGRQVRDTAEGRRGAAGVHVAPAGCLRCFLVDALPPPAITCRLSLQRRPEPCCIRAPLQCSSRTTACTMAACTTAMATTAVSSTRASRASRAASSGQSGRGPGAWLAGSPPGERLGLHGCAGAAQQQAVGGLSPPHVRLAALSPARFGFKRPKFGGKFGKWK